jgi:sulfide:quinone oxidoreductase
VPIVAEKCGCCSRIAASRPRYSHVLKAIDAGQEARDIHHVPTATPKMDYDYLHVIPPQRAPEVIRQSGLSWADKWTDQGWVEVDQQTACAICATRRSSRSVMLPVCRRARPRPR